MVVIMQCDSSGVITDVNCEPFCLFTGAYINEDYRVRVAELLLSRHADPNSPGRDDWTALHWCARAGDLKLLKLLVSRGGKVNMKSTQGELVVDIAAGRWHQGVMIYCDQQSGNLKQMARAAILSHLGRKARATAWKLPVPSKLKLFLNYNDPYPGYELVPIPEMPWTDDDLRQKKPTKTDLLEFVVTNADEYFLTDYKLPTEVSECVNSSCHSYQDLISAVKSLYLYESFKPICYEEPPARTPRIGENWPEAKRHIDQLYRV